MKRNLVLTSMLVMVLTSVFASDSTKVNNTMKKALKREYPGAVSPRWEKMDDYQMATFGFNGHLVIAYFSNEGELLGSARNVLFNELPLVVMKSLEALFADSDYTDILEIVNGEGTCYRVTAEKQDKRFLIKLNNEGNVVSVIKSKMEEMSSVEIPGRPFIKHICSFIEYFLYRNNRFI